MTETIKSIILDFQEARLETGVPRRLRIDKEIATHQRESHLLGQRQQTGQI